MKLQISGTTCVPTNKPAEKARSEEAVVVGEVTEREAEQRNWKGFSGGTRVNYVSLLKLLISFPFGRVLFFNALGVLMDISLEGEILLLPVFVCQPQNSNTRLNATL